MDAILARLPYIDQESKEWETLTKGATSLFAVTASTASDVVGVGYNSPFRRWQLDSGLIDDKPSERLQELWALGKQDEPYTVARFEQYWRTLSNSAEMWVDKTGTWPHPKYPWLAASPDRRLYFPAERGFDLLEVKSRQGDSIPEPPNDNYYIQVQVQLACCPQARGCWFFSSNRNLDTQEARYITPDPELFESLILPALQEHVRRVETGEAPPARQARKPTAQIEASKRIHIYKPDPRAYE